MSEFSRIYNLGYKFLSDQIGEKALRVELDYYRANKKNNLKDVYIRMIMSLQNRQGFTNFLGPVDQMKDILFDFDCKMVYQEYSNNPEKLFNKFHEQFPNRKFDINNTKNAWYQYTKGVISCAKFLKQFDNISDFDSFIQSFTANEFTVAALPMVLEKEISGYGFPLACDFLKESGYMDYGKPDVHLNEIFKGVGLVNKDASDYEVAKAISKMANEVGEKAVIIDKIFWIIGSGKMEVCGVNIGRQKKDFIELANL